MQLQHGMQIQFSAFHIAITRDGQSQDPLNLKGSHQKSLAVEPQVLNPVYRYYKLSRIQLCYQTLWGTGFKGQVLVLVSESCQYKEERQEWSTSYSCILRLGQK